MLFLVFNAGQQRFAIAASRVVEILPLVEITAAQGTSGLAGYFNYKGRPTIAFDICHLLCGRPATQSLSTRIVLVKHPSAPPPDHFLGLLAEHVTTVVKLRNSDLTDPGVRLQQAPHLGPVFMDQEGAVQCLYEDRLLLEFEKKPAGPAPAHFLPFAGASL